jgi:D-glutamate cyclase
VARTIRLPPDTGDDDVSDPALEAIRATVQRDLGGRGLDRDPQANLFAVCAGDFAEACRSLSRHPAAELAIVTGFWIATAERFETDGPPGAVFLSRVLSELGIRVRIYTDAGAVDILRAGCPETLVGEIPALLPASATHLLALERVGPGHTFETLHDPTEREWFAAEIPRDERGRCRSMRGIDIAEYTTPSEDLFLSPRGYTTIGVGDGGNEIGMGKVPWSTIRRAIPRGGLIACRVPTDHLIVAGVSNWGAYALAAGVAVLRGERCGGMFDPDQEEARLRRMVEAGLIDGVSGERAATVDGLPFAVHAEVLTRLGQIVGR